MYVILVNNDDTLTATKKERIMQRSKLFNNLWFLAEKEYNGYDMSKCTVMLEYVLPVSKKYRSEILTMDEEGYEDHLKYVLPLDTQITNEAGKIELQLTFVYTDLDVYGEPVQRVRKTSTTTINIIPISAWSDIIPDDALTSIDQRLIKLDAQIKHLGEVGDVLSETKADNIKYDEGNNSLRLTANGNDIGDEVKLKDCPVTEEGIPVIDLGSGQGGGDEKPDTGDSDVIEF